MKKIVYIDESNTSANKFENNIGKLIAAGAFVHNEKFIEEYNKLNLIDEQGNIIKGSDLLTAKNNDKLNKFLELIENYGNNKELYFHTFSTTFTLALDRTFNIFYGNYPIYEIEHFNIYEEIRQKYISEISCDKDHPLISSKNTEELPRDIRSQVFEEVIEMFPTYEQKIMELFGGHEENLCDINKNNHSDIISALISVVLRNQNNSLVTEIEFVIDDFNNTQTKNEIKKNVSWMGSSLGIKTTISFANDENVAGLKIADLIASVYRKSFSICFDSSRKILNTNFYERDFKLFRFHLNIVKSAYENFEIHAQVTMEERAVLKLSIERKWYIFRNNNFIKLLNTEIGWMHSEEMEYMMFHFSLFYNKLESINELSFQ